METLSTEKRDSLGSGLRDVVSYRKSGLSLNHIVGCPLDCAYCIRHDDANFQMKTPALLISDDDAVEQLVSHRYFVPHRTPVQLLNKATDPFLPTVRPHTFRVIEQLDRLGLTNHLLVISRLHISTDDCARLNAIRNLRVSLFVTYSGIDDARIEPVHSEIAEQSLRTAYEAAESYRTVLYWRPIVPGLNDSVRHLTKIAALTETAHATVFTGLFYREAIADYYRSAGLPLPYEQTARRKILPKELEDRIIEFLRVQGDQPIFRKTSCAAAYVHRTSDYNGHYGITEICDICPADQVARCARAFRQPSTGDVRRCLHELGLDDLGFEIDERSVITDSLSDSDRYYVQHSLGFQVHDRAFVHFRGRHGRAEIGWGDS